MICPFCSHEDTKVLESRMSSEKACIRRRRECENCQQRFTTYERVEISPVMVIKKNKAKEEYSREKIIKSISNSCVKYEIEQEIIQEISARIEFGISLLGKKEITSAYIGEKILEYLKPVNEIAYLRYLTVFKKFETIEDLYKEINLSGKTLTFSN
ncbi:MAG: transcriptional regulator NrdR [Candidatus Melainabacteria bacterium GWA2_34_9]|nr:MAG: transcriptional regulator NrdR [Candidatus Melainabacteria bacterium GWA2_34_9]